jgi:hypothetical protein
MHADGAISSRSSMLEGRTTEPMARKPVSATVASAVATTPTTSG